jgi:hypothetical protein
MTSFGFGYAFLRFTDSFIDIWRWKVQIVPLNKPNLVVFRPISTLYIELLNNTQHVTCQKNMSCCYKVSVVNKSDFYVK